MLKNFRIRIVFGLSQRKTIAEFLLEKNYCVNFMGFSWTLL